MEQPFLLAMKILAAHRIDWKSTIKLVSEADLVTLMCTMAHQTQSILPLSLLSHDRQHTTAPHSTH